MLVSIGWVEYTNMMVVMILMVMVMLVTMVMMQVMLLMMTTMNQCSFSTVVHCAGHVCPGAPAGHHQRLYGWPH